VVHGLEKCGLADDAASRQAAAFRCRPRQAFALDRGRRFQCRSSQPDPGRVTIRRLNREEYRNTILDLLGVPFDADDAFPADDTGYGFDTIGDVLNISPLLMEKLYHRCAGDRHQRD